VINNDTAIIYYPIGNRHYIEIFQDPKGFTMRKILKAINISTLNKFSTKLHYHLVPGIVTIPERILLYTKHSIEEKF
jgi:hypothetical protein